MNDAAAGEKLFADLEAVVRDAEALLKATAGLAGDKVQEVRGRAEGTLQQARERLETLEDDAARAVREMAGTTNKFVHENPWAAVAVAAGAGVLVGLLLSRR